MDRTQDTKTTMDGWREFLAKNNNWDTIPWLYSPVYTLQTLRLIIEDVTYRKINDWDQKGLVTSLRADKVGWRTFSIFDILKLKIIAELKKFGFTTQKIKVIIKTISSGNRTSSLSTSDLHYATLACVLGEKILLMVDENGKIDFYDEATLVKQHLRLKTSSPTLILPFFVYFNLVASVIKKKIEINEETTLANFLKNQPTEQEKKILEVVRSQEYEELKIIRSDGKTFTITAKARSRGLFSDKDVINVINARDYQNVTVSRVGGEKISIVREETIRA